MFNSNARVVRYEDPFPHIVIEDAFDEKKLDAVKESLLKESFELQNSDLFTFLQCDIEKSKNKIINSFCSYLHSQEFIARIAKVMHTKLRSIDISAFIYEKTHHLLPHDDRLKTRKVAYVINLSSLQEEDGGALALYATQGKKPTVVAKRISPHYNTLVLFGVTPQTFHEVEEIVSDTQRITVTGWFHDQ